MCASIYNVIISATINLELFYLNAWMSKESNQNSNI